MLISSFSSTPDVAFEGYCFAGADQIFGEVGAAAYARVHGDTLGPGLDGCYVVATPTPEGWELGTDHMGLGRIFTFEQAGVWAAGSSLAELAAHLRDHGVSLEPDLVTLAGMSIRNRLTNQMVSRQTVIQGIELLPTYQRVRVTAKGLHRVQIAESPVRSYADELREFLAVWLARTQTIIHDEDSTLTSDLTDALDSRVIFSLLLSAGIADLDPRRWRIAGPRTDHEDLPHQLAAEHGVALNGALPPDRTKVNSRQALASWQAHSMGLYMPVYFLEKEPDPWSAHTHTASGGSLTATFAAGRGPRELERFRRYFSTRELFTVWQARVESDLQEYQSVRPHMPVDAMHDRQFRTRLHFGHRPHRRSMLMPLAGREFENLRRLRPTDHHGQAELDIMESLVPGIGDRAPKGVSPSDHEQLRMAMTRVDWDRNVPIGAVYAAQPSHTSSTSAESPSAALRWTEEALDALGRSEVLEIMGEEAAAVAIAGAQEIRDGRTRVGAQWPAFMAMSYALAIDFALGR